MSRLPPTSNRKGRPPWPPVGRKPEERSIELPDRVSVKLAGLAGKTREGLLAFAVGVGLQVFKTLLEEDRTQLCGQKGRHNPTGRAANRHGSQPSSVTLGGRRVAVDRPRVRSVAGGELGMPTWDALASDEHLLGEMALGRMLAGLSSRNYPIGLEPVGTDLDTSGTSRSSVSRRFVARTQVALGELMAKDLSEIRFCALFADGLEIAEHTMVCALGLDPSLLSNPSARRPGGDPGQMDLAVSSSKRAAHRGAAARLSQR